MAYECEKYYLSTSLTLLTITSVCFHGTKTKYFFILDQAAIFNYMFYGLYKTSTLTNKDKFITYFVIIYTIVTYFGGKQYNILSFDPNLNLQQFFHSLIHIFTGYSAYTCIINNCYKIGS